MSEDEFVVLLEHAGILETSDENDMEFMEETVLREWLERDGVQLFTTQMTTKGDADLVLMTARLTLATAGWAWRTTCETRPTLGM
jgi:G:T-mismatch repair DNA endonuclease (very short patch repair protein)